jgi:TonB family protein
MTLSFILPGLGQFYSGEKRKGILFTGVSIVNLFLFGSLIFSTYLFNFLVGFGKAFHLTPNRTLFGHLGQLSLSSPPVLVTAIFFLIFIVYAAKDAYQSVLWRRQPIYPGHALTMSEATSGSYLAHCALLTDCFIFALFFLIPQHPQTQETVIVFDNSQPTKQQRVPAQKKSNNVSKAAGPHTDSKPVKTTPDATKQERSSPPMPSPAVAHQAAPRSTSARISPPAKPIFVPRLIARSISPVNLPQPLPRVESSATTPHPMPRSIAPATTPLPSAPHPTQARSYPPQPLVAFVPKGTTGAGRSSPPSPLPFKASSVDLPGPLPTRSGSANFNPQPNLRSGNFSSGGPSSPGPAPVAAGPGKDHLFAAPVPTGGERGHRFGDSSPGPAPERAGKSRDGINSPLAVLPRLGSSLPSGIPGGKRESGDPGVPNADKNGNPKSRISPQTEPFDFGEYMADLQRKIKRAWLPPRQPDSRQVIVTFKIHRNGEFSHLRLSQSSGNADSDKAAMAAVERAAPFRPFPPACPEDEVDIEFTFDYKVFSGSGVYRRF